MRGGAAFAEGRFRFVADVLIHEQIHQWQHEVTGQREVSYHGHGRTFCAQCNAIGSTLELAPVITKKRGKHDGPKCAQWPHSVRPPDYYLGAYTPPVPRSRDEGDEIARARAFLELRGFTVIAPESKGA